MAQNTIKKISAEAKRIRKKHPHKYDKLKNSWAKGYIPEAARKLKRAPKKRKRVSSVGAAPKKKRSVSKRRSRAKAKAKPKRVQVVRVTRQITRIGKRRPAARRRPAAKRRRIGSNGNSGGSSNKGLLIGLGVAVIGYLLLKNQDNTQYPGTYYANDPRNLPPLQQTGNLTRDQQSQQILNYAMATGLALNAIANLIDKMNNSDDQGMKNMYDNINTTGDVSAWV